MFCPNCGKELSDNSRFCTKCGTRLDVAAFPQATPQESAPEKPAFPQATPQETIPQNSIPVDPYANSIGGQNPNTGNAADDWANDIEVAPPADSTPSDDWADNIEVSVPVDSMPTPNRVNNDYTAYTKNHGHVYTKPQQEKKDHLNMGLPEEEYDDDEDYDEKEPFVWKNIYTYVALGAVAIIVVAVVIIIRLTTSSGIGHVTTVSNEYAEAGEDYGGIGSFETENTEEASSDAISDEQVEATSEAPGSELDETTANVEEEQVEEPKLIDDPAIHTYELVVSDVSWTQAYEQCLMKGGHLVRISSDEEYEAILNQISSEGKEKIKFWIGGARDNENNYRWVYNDDYNDSQNIILGDEILNSDSKYSSYWLGGEPSLYDETTQTVEDRMNMFYMKSQNRWVWNDVPNDVLSIASFYSGSMGYICEYE